MSRKLVLCCDGTANEFAVDLTNVVKLFYTLNSKDKGQLAFYHPGLGTMAPPGALFDVERKTTVLLGQAIGYGLQADITDAYRFLMNNYQDGDQIYLFGFSRGAYTARSVAALVHMYGLIRPNNEPLVPYAMRMMASNKLISPAGTKTYFNLAEGFSKTFALSRPPIKFIGVWDTVSSVGWCVNPLSLPHTAQNSSIEVVRHAIALDERRAFFRTNLFHPVPGGAQDLKQVWFPGVHCDIGGGYPEAESGLSKISLQWMLTEARKAGLSLDEQRVAEVLGGSPDYAKPDSKGMMHESLSGWWKLAEYVPKKHWDAQNRTYKRHMNRSSRRPVPDGSWIHESALERGDDYIRLLPANRVIESWQ